MKKTFNIIALASAALLFGGCDKWFDVNPRSQTKGSVLYKTEDGFKSSLNGIYVSMAQENLYGLRATVDIPETFARHWTIPTTNENYMNRLANFDFTYSAVEARVESLWLAYYNTIAQVNDLLANLRTTGVAIGGVNRALLEGEALGLRAYLHFDLLRFFGPVPHGADMASKAIPYVTEMTIDPQKAMSLTYRQVLTKIEEDFADAERILAEADPIVFNSNAALNASGSKPVFTLDGDTATPDKWHFLRQGRFNYYTCLGTRARFYQWTGDRDKATAYAKKVIEAVNGDGTPKFELTTENAYSSENANLTMFGEQLFGLQISSEGQIAMEENFTTPSTRFTQTNSYIGSCYESANPEDIRNRPRRYWEEKTEAGVTTNHFRKYVGSGNIKPNRRMPLLRLAEMYLIVIENLPADEALPYFRTFRTARAMGVATENGFAADKMARVEREYRKEFFGEGQMHFFYKRLNYERYTWPANFDLPANAYVIPKPKSQMAFE